MKILPERLLVSWKRTIYWINLINLLKSVKSMSLTAQHNGIIFSVGDRIKVTQRIKEGEKKRLQTFDGLVLGIRGSNENTMFTVRRIGEAQVGIERIFPLTSPTIEKIEVVRKGGSGVKHAKIYYVREKSKKGIEKIYSRSTSKGREILLKTVSKTAKKSKAKK